MSTNDSDFNWFLYYGKTSFFYGLLIITVEIVQIGYNPCSMQSEAKVTTFWNYPQMKEFHYIIILTCWTWNRAIWRNTDNA